MKMCIKILVLMTITVTVSARKTKEGIRVQYLGSPKTDFENEDSKSRDGFGSDISRHFGGSDFEDRYKVPIPNYGSFSNHRQFQQPDNDHGFESLSNLYSGNSDKNYRKATEMGFREKTHEERPLHSGDLEHGIGLETADRELRVQDRSIENHSHKSSSNNFKQDSSFQGASRKFYSSGSSNFQTDSSEHIGQNHRDLNNRYKSHDFEDSNRRSQSNKRDFVGNKHRESRNNKKDQFEIIPNANGKILEHETVAKNTDIIQSKGEKENVEYSLNDKTTNNRDYQNTNEKNNQENTRYQDNLNQNNNEPSPENDSRKRVKVDEISTEKSISNRSLTEEISRNNGATPQRNNEDVQVSSGVGRKINDDRSNQRADVNIRNVNKTKDEEQWIWGEGEEKMTPVPVPSGVDDRASFKGDQCPTGKVKIGNQCVSPD